MLTKSELEEALSLLRPALDKELEQVERQIARNFRPSEQHTEGRVEAPTSYQQVAYDAGYAKGMREAFPVLAQWVANLKS